MGENKKKLIGRKKKKKPTNKKYELLFNVDVDTWTKGLISEYHVTLGM